MSRIHLGPPARGLLAAIVALSAGLAAQEGAAGGDKLDVGLASTRGHAPVFVRMADQLFRKAGDHEAFCAEHEETARSRVREVALTRLRAAAARDREALKDTVAALTKSGDLRAVRHFWIVNGFACDATAEACAELATRPEVAFVYRQRQPGGGTQHRDRWRGERWQQARRKDVEAAGIKVNEIADKGPFQAAMVKVYDDYLKANPDMRKLVDLARSTD